MLPIVTPQEMAAIDQAAPEPLDELIERAGAALAREAVKMLGGCYGRRVVVLAGKGNNGADGRAAARRLAHQGVRTAVINPDDAGNALPPAHLTIDAAYGTGLGRAYLSPTPPAQLTDSHQASQSAAPILAADIASGVDGLTGEIRGDAWAATRTLAFGALKPGNVLHPGAQHSGRVTVAGIGLDVSSAQTHLVEASDVADWLPVRQPEAHKWRAACWVIAGSPGMTGAAHLVARAALRGGSGYVRLTTPGVKNDPISSIEVVKHSYPISDWSSFGSDEDHLRFHAMVIGPGLSQDPDTAQAVRVLVARASMPLVIDGDGLNALGRNHGSLLARRTSPTVLTPHDGEYHRLTGSPPSADRFAAARSMAKATGAHVLLKGATTVVASPDGTALAITNGDARLATAGTGDVLAGLIGGLLSAGVDPQRAAAAAAWLHGQAASLSPANGMIASDLLDAIPRAWSQG